jgi:WD40 repeat protein
MGNVAKSALLSLAVSCVVGWVPNLHAQLGDAFRVPKPKASLRGSPSAIYAAAFSPDGKTLASGGAEKKVRLWDLATGRTTAAFPGATDTIHSIAFSPDGKTLATAEFNWAVRTWDVATGENTATISGRGRGGNQAFAIFNPNGGSLALISVDKKNSVILWDPKSGKRTALEGHLRPVTGAAFRPDGKVLASSSLDKTIKLWDVVTGANIDKLEGQTHAVGCVAFHPGGELLASADRSIWLWDLAKRERISEFRRLASVPNTSLEFSPDGKLLASDQAGIWDVATGKEKTYSILPINRFPLAFSRDGKTLATSPGPLHEITLWNVPRGE